MQPFFPWPILPILYAETHYRLGGLSFIHRRWPEIIADAPCRIEPGCSVPLLILVKDAHRFPVTLPPPRVELSYSDGTHHAIQPFRSPVFIDKPMWTRITHIEPPPSFSGTLTIRIHFRAIRQKDQRIQECMTDNLPGSSHAPLYVRIPCDPFPKFSGWVMGDLHVHSSFTSDQVEFGAPLDVIAEMGKCSGLDFAAITDHSYDLDDRIDDYLRSDPQREKWTRLLAETESSHGSHDFLFIPGEEISCGNRNGKNVHLLLLNNRFFIEGSGDSAEALFRTKPEHRIPEILESAEQGSLAFAAHPEVPFHPLHWIFLRRWKWTRSDYQHPKLSGLQILNGPDDLFFRKGLKRWISLLLQGKKLSIVAGNDSHGNFNRFRQLLLPFVGIREAKTHVFGRARTAVYVGKRLDRQHIIEALRAGRSTVTTGPALNCVVHNEKGEEAIPGDTLRGHSIQVRLRADSSEEFGKFEEIKIWAGSIGDRKESLLEANTHLHGGIRIETRVQVPQFTTNAYIRCEATTKNGIQQAFALTNPVWIHPSE